MTIIIQAVYLFVLALVLAILEVQIEGPHGWAEKLPSWRPKAGHWSGRFYSWLTGGKPLTGYHLSIFGFLLVVLHLPFVWGVRWSGRGELAVLSMFFLVAATWDFLWFAVNPHFGLKKFKAIHIWWHQKWLGPWPLDYYLALVLSVLLYLPLANNYVVNLVEWLKIFGVFLAGCALTILIRWRK